MQPPKLIVHFVGRSYHVFTIHDTKLGLLHSDGHCFSLSRVFHLMIITAGLCHIQITRMAQIYQVNIGLRASALPMGRKFRGDCICHDPLTPAPSERGVEAKLVNINKTDMCANDSWLHCCSPSLPGYLPTPASGSRDVYRANRHRGYRELAL